MQASATEYKKWKRISGAEDSIGNMDTAIKENAKDPNSKHPGNPGHNEKTNLGIKV